MGDMEWISALSSLYSGIEEIKNVTINMSYNSSPHIETLKLVETSWAEQSHTQDFL
jgi:hypothetical protein